MNELPISEIFHSLQGEGVWTGTPMLFIRLAGCNVGTNPIYGNCETADGRVFQCDTDYRMKLGKQSLLDIVMREGREGHICITGGEPFLHDLGELILIANRGKQVHIETSGTLLIPEFFVWLRNSWISCSPKRGFLPENRPCIREWKFLYGPGFNEEAVIETVGNSGAPVFIQPINAIDSVDSGNTTACQEIISRHPNWRLSIQLHKILGVQ